MMENVAIVGVGLIGGSIGLAIRKRRVARNVIGIGRSASRLRIAKSVGAVDRGTTDLARGVAEAELVVVCTPVATIATGVLATAEHCPPGTLITDAGSTKEQIVGRVEAAMAESRLSERAHFVGSHPIAGSEQTGVKHARADLLVGKVVVVTPTRRTRSNDVDRTEQFWTKLGASVIRKSPRAHDKALAVTSHLPHLISALMSATTSKPCLPLVGTGWKDATRIAAGDVELWRQIFADNREHLMLSLEQFIEKLNVARHALATGDDKTIEQLLKAGKRNRESI